MRSSSAFFRLFPPPTFMLMPHAGLDISDDALRCLAYSGIGPGRKISLFGSSELPRGLFEGGDVKDENEFVSRLADFGKKHGLNYVKISVPEEKAYLFQTEVPSTMQSAIEQNIEFKLEENVPLSASDAVFYFDLLPISVTGGSLRASVSVVPRAYIEKYMSLIERAGLAPVSFETVPKAIARSVIPHGSDSTRLIVHVMSRKTGMYIVCGNVINFAFTAAWGSTFADDAAKDVAEKELRKEIARVRSYWLSHGNGKDIEEAILVGKNAVVLEQIFRKADGESPLGVRLADVWVNAINLNKHLPPVSRVDSLEYAVSAGLAFDTQRSV